jgi:hypothetical protein
VTFLEQAQFTRSYDRLRAILDAQFVEDVACMPLDGVDGNDKLPRNLLASVVACCIRSSAYVSRSLPFHGWRERLRPRRSWAIVRKPLEPKKSGASHSGGV